jgi:hypothetical protein
LRAAKQSVSSKDRSINNCRISANCFVTLLRPGEPGYSAVEECGLAPRALLSP